MTRAARHSPELTAAAVIERAGRFLVIEELVHERPVFNQPAGHVEPGETPADAVIRETLEEAAWHFVPESVCGVYRWTEPASGRCFLRVAFCGDVTGRPRARALDAGILRTLWLSRAQLAGRATRLRSPLVLRCIDDYLDGRRLPLELPAGDTLLARATLL
jgi:8-oxo-dGTP pyrophosphatase MutT (NUDIX family)